MSRFDRYMLSQLLTLFGFFALVLVLVYWINRAVGLFDRLIGDGQSALVFLEFSLLTLPNVIRLVLPIAAFAASVYVTNRLSQDGELVVMQATGFSAFRLARPVLIFGLIVTIMLLVLAHLIVPLSRAALAERTVEIESNVTAKLLSEGRFIHPSKGLTFYIREISVQGELLDVLLVDDRAPSGRSTYTARRAVLVKSDAGPKLVMFDGLVQSITRSTQALAVTHFTDLTYDMGAVLGTNDRKGAAVEEMPTLALLWPDPALVAASGGDRAAFLTEAHGRFANPLLAPAAALIGFSTLILGAFSRFGLWRQIVGAVILLIVIQMVANWATGASLKNAAMWPVAYIAPVLGLGLGLALLAHSQRPRRLRRSRASAGAPV